MEWTGASERKLDEVDVSKLGPEDVYDKPGPLLNPWLAGVGLVVGVALLAWATRFTLVNPDTAPHWPAFGRWTPWVIGLMGVAAGLGMALDALRREERKLALAAVLRPSPPAPRGWRWWGLVLFLAVLNIADFLSPMGWASFWALGFGVILGQAPYVVLYARARRLAWEIIREAKGRAEAEAR